jgi:hypothetical protein
MVHYTHHVESPSRPAGAGHKRAAFNQVLDEFRRMRIEVAGEADKAEVLDFARIA